mmetsp:Transcript_50274/g.100116  ORF Transcript_50274/g.100116 Transcript_50274/m.100116 type:complete len:126 (-) Transcript_50274:224-601(-)|eukprot:CAMPEP_0174737952 /NCGR_PEP_ID=MMETSP1094-20130205/69113_1 /TAXON_ID=156173 /ORGANISM="Chrysochromulina brevifilum, Strain UTEX LB 985" /LENGTH=125 /DNA_ID=CAMNT_0015941269 /DNA_START=51 /DNA_END=428 /DNA_ORIENTATION=+
MNTPKDFATLAEAKAACKATVEILFAHKDELLGAAAACSNDQEKIAKLMPEVQKLLMPKMQELGFEMPQMPQMALLMGFKAMKDAATKWKDEGGDVISEAVTSLSGALSEGKVNFNYEELLKKLS